MTGSDLRYLAAVSDLSRLDIETASIGLFVQEGRICARYRGAYTSGERYLEFDGPEFACEINAAKFKALAALFDDTANVNLKMTGQRLQIGQGRGAEGRGLSLAIQRDEIEELTPYDKMPATTSVKLNADDLGREIELATDFVAKNMATPLLTGIKLDISAKRVRITSTDALSAFFVSSLGTISAHAAESVVVTVPSLDFFLGIKTIGGGEARLEVITARGDDKQLVPVRVRVVGATSRFSCGLLEGEWPDTSIITGYKDYVTALEIAGGSVRQVVAGAKALSSSILKSGIEIVSDDKRRLIVQNMDTGEGQFMTRVGQLDHDDEINFRYSIAAMALVSKLGDVITLHIPKDANRQTKALSGHRQCWVNVQAQ